MQPRIETGRLQLTPVSADDLAAMTRILHDPQVRHFLLDDEVLPDHVVRDFIHHSGITAAQGLGLWMVRLDDAPVGVAGLKPVDNADAIGLPGLAGMAEIIIGLMPSSWGQGYAGEVIEALLCHAFEELRLPVVAGIADEPNSASRRMLERAGFVRVAVGPGKVHSLIGHELSAERWRSKPVP